MVARLRVEHLDNSLPLDGQTEDWRVLWPFNGVTYYKIPLADSKQESASGRQARPATSADGTIIVPRAKE